MWTMPANYIKLRSLSLLELNELNEAQKEPYGERFVHLMEHPEERNADIMRDCVGYLVARNADETGDEEGAAKYAEDLCSFAVLPFATISEVPLPVRGVLHSTGAAMVAAICDQQARIELTGIESLEIGDRMGRQNKAAASRMSTPQKKQMAKDGQLKKTLNQLEAAKKSDKLKE